MEVLIIIGIVMEIMANSAVVLVDIAQFIIVILELPACQLKHFSHSLTTMAEHSIGVLMQITINGSIFHNLATAILQEAALSIITTNVVPAQLVNQQVLDRDLVSAAMEIMEHKAMAEAAIDKSFN
jgi:hypothetical protein